MLNFLIATSLSLTPLNINVADTQNIKVNNLKQETLISLPVIDTLNTNTKHHKTKKVKNNFRLRRQLRNRRQRGYRAVASWYGGYFHGRKMANGRRFNMYSNSCAHKTFRFGTILRVTNTANGRSTKCEVEDRGPFIKGRELDLSKGSFSRIALLTQGLINIKIEKIN